MFPKFKLKKKLLYFYNNDRDISNSHQDLYNSFKGLRIQFGSVSENFVSI